jgi:hypothetical protein
MFFVFGIVLVFALAAPRAAAPPTAVLVELFTSEGCSSCPPADTLLQSLVESQPIPGAVVIALGQHVDYWDELGWKDRFSSKALTDRQRGYGRVLSVDSIYTPQMIVDGRSEFVGNDAAAAQRAILKAASLPHASVSIAIEASVADRFAVSVAAAGLPALSRGDRADIVVAVVENGLRSQVHAGENNGRTLVHTAVVHTMTPIGDATPERASARTDVTIAPTWQREQLRIVAFVQERASRHVLGAAVMALPGAHR